MEVTDSDKHSSLLWRDINYDRKNINITGPRKRDNEKEVKRVILDLVIFVTVTAKCRSVYSKTFYGRNWFYNVIS